MKLKTVLSAVFAILALAVSTSGAEKPVMHVTIFVDDGPSVNTKAMMEILKRENVPANFNFIGQNVEKYPEIAALAVKEGFTVNDHAYAHQHPAQLTDAQLFAEMKGGYDAILKATGKAPHAYWPPFVEYDPRMAGILTKLNLKMYHFPVVAGADDWVMENSADKIRALSLANAKDGCIMLFHEWRNETVQVLPSIIQELKKRGAVFMTYDELAAYDESIGKK
jgi:peptidoglycan/xylan/chitin deacetylase (PgdA/CDA1 family)